MYVVAESQMWTWASLLRFIHLHNQRSEEDNTRVQLMHGYMELLRHLLLQVS